MNTLSLEENALCSLLAKRVKAYFQDAAHRKEFEDWYEQKHGKPYDWRKPMRDEVKH